MVGWPVPRYAVMKEPEIIHKIPCSWDIILYGGGPGLYSGNSARSNPRGCACTPIRLMHGTGGSFVSDAPYTPHTLTTQSTC